MPTLKLLAIGLGITFMISCSGDETSATKNIFGEDSRVAVDGDTFPFNALGRIDSGCTGFLIAPNLVGTAAHCVVNSSDGSLKTNLRYFERNFVDGEASSRTKILHAWVGSFHPEEVRQKDWAILQTEDTTSEIGTALTGRAVVFAEEALPYQVQLAGYQTDINDGGDLATSGLCTIRGIGKEGRLLNDCDSFSGVSGAPLMRGTEVVAIAVSEYRGGANGSVRRDAYSDDYANVAIPLAEFLAVAEQLVATIGQDQAQPETLRHGFAIEVPDRPDPANQARISLYAQSRFSGGTFLDNSGQIVCRGDGENCSGTYEKGTRVVLTAPRSLQASGNHMHFRYWVCNKTTESFPHGINLCEAGSRSCSLNIQDDLICSAMYR